MPEGVITERAVVYFVVLKVRDTNLVLGRRSEGRAKDLAFLHEDFDETLADTASALGLGFFDETRFIPLEDFKKLLGRRFGLIYTDVDESLENRGRRVNAAHAPTPSIRSFTSFLLQHQNLVANKHAIFYRFDEKEKRDQAIGHLKIFLGFVRPEYFQLLQELHQWEQDLRSLELQVPRQEELNEASEGKVNLALAAFSAISGTQLVPSSASDLLLNPSQALESVRAKRIVVSSVSDAHIDQRDALERRRSVLLSKRRGEQNKVSLIRSSIGGIKAYIQKAEDVPIPTEEQFVASHCPFCGSYHPTVEREANRLGQAIDWLNRELDRSAYLPASLVEDERRSLEWLEENAEELREVDAQIEAIDSQTADLEQLRTQLELAVKAKVQVEAVLEGAMEDKLGAMRSEITALKGRIARRKEFIARQFDVLGKVREAEIRLAQIMSEIGKDFAFEESYRPIRLQFSLETFDLWHEMGGSGGKRIYLRSMGSGANWLYSHLTLFLALHRYFCELGDSCCIPSFVFFDQPSQVYFPTVLDVDSDFDPKKISEKDIARRRRPVDEDISAVTNLFSRLVQFCENTKAATGVEPQIIVTDHADNLRLAGGKDFKEFIRAKWRERGLVATEEFGGG